MIGLSLNKTKQNLINYWDKSFNKKQKGNKKRLCILIQGKPLLANIVV